MKYNVRNYSRSKVFAWFIAISTTFLSTLSIFKGMPEVIMTILPFGYGLAAGLYGYKIHSLVKEKQINLKDTE